MHYLTSVKVRVAVIGCGYFARYHIEAWSRLPDADLVALCDQDLLAAERYGLEFGVSATFSNKEDLVTAVDFDVIDIITPPPTHLALIEFFAELGKHIICQKPLAPTYVQSLQIAAVVRQMAGRFMVHENFRFQPWYRQIHQEIKSGRVGQQIHTVQVRLRTGDGWGEDAYLARQPYFRKMKRFFMQETGVHYVDVARFLLGEVAHVTGHLRRFNPRNTGRRLCLGGARDAKRSKRDS